ncbi:hypothetical protein QBC36DRAFT_346984 [Triangularia setosa]|uniref:Uncharacterized protein n=1 Tax=Triangularia setosa TaxID=2587417 RepID=A0AAN6W611_9PEZI|nr:hypothetical protein QBC36DRAFT_346984 [Podospora setosa]
MIGAAHSPSMYKHLTAVHLSACKCCRALGVIQDPCAPRLWTLTDPLGLDVVRSLATQGPHLLLTRCGQETETHGHHSRFSPQKGTLISNGNSLVARLEISFGNNEPQTNSSTSPPFCAARTIPLLHKMQTVEYMRLNHRSIAVASAKPSVVERFAAGLAPLPSLDKNVCCCAAPRPRPAVGENTA